ncbi:hypothetical protein AWB79_04194 [Caballeronia hypogeia]|uniref:Uncharacterized protein n=1 Tax=Caballeronia hypogeia TaxID=1777140 RepID=A0A158BSY1_9BURK|nr:hypothetical protein [Caballeronia hypogeia]SAK73194.1 hypothetical protein AWB79_04194 [Caballeronia hypogeia]
MKRLVALLILLVMLAEPAMAVQAGYPCHSIWCEDTTAVIAILVVAGVVYKLVNNRVWEWRNKRRNKRRD